MRGIVHFEDLGEEVRITTGHVLKRYFVEVWIGFRQLGRALGLP
jgi:hypothetical protein